MISHGLVGLVDHHTLDVGGGAGVTGQIVHHHLWS